MRHRHRGIRETRIGSTLQLLLLIFLATSLLVHVSGSAANPAQNRDQCDRCCEKAGYDEYYAEQCKLRCFRNPDYCTDGKGVKSATPEKAPTPQTTQRRSPDQPNTVRPQSDQPRTAPPATRPAQPKAAFRFPSTLSLIPGREQETAAQLLAANGIPPQHPSYPSALAAVQNILVEFARANPSGGSLPTAQLERVMRQFKR